MKEKLKNKSRNLMSLSKAKIKRIENCDHYMVICDDKCDRLKKRHNYTYICLKCGLTNGYHYFNDMDSITMNYLFSKAFMYGVTKNHGSYINEMDYIIELFDETKSKLPKTRNEILCEEIKFLEKEKERKIV